jgi:hypothetical protein
MRGESENIQAAFLQKAVSKARSQGKRAPCWELPGRQTMVLLHLPRQVVANAVETESEQA